MCIKKEGGLYRVGSKLYTKDELVGPVASIVISLLFLALVMWAMIHAAVDTNRVNKLLASDDPAANLILALDSDPSWASAGKALDEIGDPLLLTLAPACEGQAVGGTVYQDSQPGPHPLVILLPDGKSYRRTYYYLKQWGPDSRQAEDVQLVVCVYKGERRIEVCKYGQGQGSYTRIQNMIYFDIIEAATGRTYLHQVFEGSLPGKCPSSMSSSGGHKEIRGDVVDTSKFFEFLPELFE